MTIEAVVVGKGRKSEVYNYYFSFPISPVGYYDLTDRIQVREFMELHSRLLKWAWLVYAEEYIRDIQALCAKAKGKCVPTWSTTWQEALKQCGCSIYLIIKLMLISKSLQRRDWRVQLKLNVRPDNHNSK